MKQLYAELTERLENLEKKNTTISDSNRVLKLSMLVEITTLARIILLVQKRLKDGVKPPAKIIPVFTVLTTEGQYKGTYSTRKLAEKQVEQVNYDLGCQGSHQIAHIVEGQLHTKH